MNVEDTMRRLIHGANEEFKIYETNIEDYEKDLCAAKSWFNNTILSDVVVTDLSIEDALYYNYVFETGEEINIGFVDKTIFERALVISAMFLPVMAQDDKLGALLAAYYTNDTNSVSYLALNILNAIIYYICN